MSKRESEKVVKLSSAQEPGTVIPAKRKLVKRLMYTCLANVICPSRRRRPSSSGATKTCSCFKMGKPIYPHTPMYQLCSLNNKRSFYLLFWFFYFLWICLVSDPTRNFVMFCEVVFEMGVCFLWDFQGCRRGCVSFGATRSREETQTLRRRYQLYRTVLGVCVDLLFFNCTCYDY